MSETTGVERVVAKLEIRNLLVRLARLADSGDLDDYLGLLTDDVVWEMPASPHLNLAASERRGRDEIAAGVLERTSAGIQGKGSDTVHVVTTTSVELDGDDRATADSVFLFYGTASTAPTLRSMGRYHDTLRRTEGVWKLARRAVLFG